MSQNEIAEHSGSLQDLQDLQDLEIETFEIDTLSELGIDAAVSTGVTVATTSSSTSSSCG